MLSWDSLRASSKAGSHMRIFTVVFLSITTATIALGAEDRARKVNQLFAISYQPTKKRDQETSRNPFGSRSLAKSRLSRHRWLVESTSPNHT